MRSPYGDQFAAYFANGTVALHDAVDMDAIAEIADLMPSQYREAIYVRIARRQSARPCRTGLVRHRPCRPGQAAKHAAGPVPTEERRLFYGILRRSPPTIRNVRRLGLVEPASLPPEDRDLLAAGKAMADALLKTASVKPTRVGKPRTRWTV
ncbi:MAG: hypothetical protein H6816_15785 [Phycisphaerales bacterium]|nr:hypothetical protein [Phycisphaerales bacterium]